LRELTSAWDGLGHRFPAFERAFRRDILGFPLMAGLTVTIAVIVMCLAAAIPQLSAIPASVFGYSMTFAYLLQTPDKMTKDVLLGASFSNPLVVISVSIVIEVYLGKFSAVLAEKWTTK
jgi:hypothetical protein